MFISITHKSDAEPRGAARLSKERKQFELLFDASGLKYEYWGYTIPPNAMKKMNKWYISESDICDSWVLEISKTFFCYLSE